jgi:phenylpyruvate tautomerase PptA (4-oxalocrotonate tautomerase family)
VPEDQGDPMVEVHWFDRGSEMKAQVAKKLTQVVQKYSKSEYIAVVFFDLPKTNYFENGQHF